MCGHPHLTGPTSTAQPPGARRAVTVEVRLVFDEQSAPLVGDGPETAELRSVRRLRTGPDGQLLDRGKPFEHRPPQPAVHASTSDEISNPVVVARRTYSVLRNDWHAPLSRLCHPLCPRHGDSPTSGSCFSRSFDSTWRFDRWALREVALGCSPS